MMERKNIKLIKENNGITLIALVITIIILIILAGVSINLLLGENGLIKKVQNSKEEYTIEAIREKLDLVKGSDYIEQKGDNSIDTYFEALEKEKIEPYTITNKQKITNDIGSIEVDNKYSYIVTIIGNNNIKIEYEGKVDEITRDPDKVTITITGNQEQESLPVTLNASIKINEKDVTSGKYIINTIAEELGTEDSAYTEQISNSNIEVKLEEVNSYYIHTLTLDKYGRKQETIKGPIVIDTKYHVHTGSSSLGDGCYTNVKYTYGSSSCYYYTTNWTKDTWGNYDYQYKCYKCGAIVHLYSASIWSNDGRDHESSAIHNNCPGVVKEKTYTLGCNKTEDTIEGYTITY